MSLSSVPTGFTDRPVPVDVFPGQVHDLPADFRSGPEWPVRGWRPRLVLPGSSHPEAAPERREDLPGVPDAGPGRGVVDPSEFTEPCAGRVRFGDVVLFTEPVLGGTFERPTLLGHRRIAGQVVGENAGPDRRGAHFTVEVLASDGCDPVEPGAVLRRKATLLSRWTARRRPWANPAEKARLLSDAGDALPEIRRARRLPRRVCASPMARR